MQITYLDDFGPGYTNEQPCRVKNSTFACPLSKCKKEVAKLSVDIRNMMDKWRLNFEKIRTFAC